MLFDAAMQQMEVGMPRVSSRPDTTNERPSSFVSLLSGWVQQGVESFFATQRILVDLAMRQNTTAMNTIRRELSRDEAQLAEEDSPRNILVEMAVEGTANYIEAQRILLDLAQQENEIVLKGVKERVSEYGTVATMTNVIRRSIDTFIEMQQNFLTIASKRTQGWLENSGDAKAAGANNPVSLAGEAMKEFVETQKKFLDVISEETRKTDGKKDHVSKKADRTELVELGREATDSFIHAQKRLLDLAGQQVNVNTQAVSRAMDIRMPVRLMPMVDIASEGVKSFVDAEKALVNSMMKSRTHPKETVEAANSHAKRPARRTRTVKAKRSRAAAATTA
jgi:hypothetical protein